MKSTLTGGNGFYKVLRFSLPLILGAFVQQLYYVTDSLIVSNFIGSTAMAAIGATGSSIFFLFSVSNGLASACAVVIAQSLGTNLEENVQAAIASTLFYTVGCGFVVCTVGYLCVEPLLCLLQTPDDLRPQAVTYLHIYVGLGFGQILYNNTAATLHAFGDSKTPMAFLILSAALNIVLDLLFVAKLQWAIQGAAIATVLSQAVSGVLCLGYGIRKYPIFRLKRGQLRPQRDNICEIARIGLPIAFQSALLSVGDMIVTGIINTYGTVVVTAYSAVYRIHQFCVIPFLQFAMAFCTFTAQNIGADQVACIRRTMRQSASAVVCASLLIGFGLRIFHAPLLSLFIPENDPMLDAIMQTGGDFLCFVPLLYPFLGLIWLYNYALRGVGEVRIPLLSGGIELVSKIVLPFALGKMLGYMGVWYGYPLCWVLGWIPSLIFYHRGNWAEQYRKRQKKQQ